MRPFPISLTIEMLRDQPLMEIISVLDVNDFHS